MEGCQIVYNSTFVHGLQVEDEYLHTSWTPATADVFYLLGEDIAGRFKPTLPSAAAQYQFTAAKLEPDAIYIGKKLVAGVTPVTALNGYPFYLAGMKSTTSSGTTHVFTIDAPATYSLPSVTWHHEERGGTTATLRDDLGCVCSALVCEWDWRADSALKTVLTWAGACERNHAHATKPAVQLDAYPTHLTGTTTVPFTLGTTTTWNSVTVQAGFFQYAWNNNLDPPVYAFGGCAGNGSDEHWPVAIRKTLPGYGAFRFHFQCDVHDVDEAIVADASNQKTLVFKFTKPGDAAKYVQFSLASATVETADKSHLIGDDAAYVVASGKFTAPTITVADGVAKTNYGESA